MNINGTDLSTFGFKIRGNEARQLSRLHGESSRAVVVPGSIGALRTGGALGSRPLIIPGYLKANTHAALLTAIDDLAAALQGELTIRLDDYSDREWIGWLQDLSAVEEIGPGEVATFGSVRLEILLPDPTARARTVTNLVGSGALDLANMPSELATTITNGGTGAITEVTINIRAGGAGGTILRSLTWQGSVATSDVLAVDAGLYTVTNAGNNAIDGLTADSEFPIADPREGADYLEVLITGGGGETISTDYRKRW